MQDLTKMTVPELRSLYRDILTNVDSLKDQLASVLYALDARCGEELKRLFDLKGKATGDVTTEIEGVKIQYSIDKTIKWDEALLREAASLIPADKVEKIITAKLSVSEKTYGVLADILEPDNPALSKINAARTVKLSEPKIAFAKE